MLQNKVNNSENNLEKLRQTNTCHTIQCTIKENHKIENTAKKREKKVVMKSF